MKKVQQQFRRSFRYVFGNEDARSDALLSDCFVTPPDVWMDKPIISGRWGTGKSAVIIHRNSDLKTLLNDIDEELAWIWYIDEKEVDFNGLIELKAACSENTDKLIQAMVDYWKIEIIQRACQMLSALRPYYGQPEGEHWSKITRVSEPIIKNSAAIPIVSKLFGLLLGNAKDGQIIEIQQYVELFENENLNECIRKCLADIPVDQIVPSIAIEPIDSPQSKIEEHGSLAQDAIDALLIAFERHFAPAGEHYFPVQLCIPSHRFRSDRIENGHKLPQHASFCRWTQNSLRSFINERIKWEFKRVGKHFVQVGTNDPWSVLFGKEIINNHCVKQIVETSFEYVLRHTHHRARDLQRVARKIVEHQSSVSKCSCDDVLRGRGGLEIKPDIVRSAVSKAVKETAPHRIREASYLDLRLAGIVKRLNGLSIPASRKTLMKKLIETNESYVDFLDKIQLLWDAGIMGIELTAHNEGAVSNLKNVFRNAPHRSIRNRQTNKVLEKWFIFHYSYEDYVQNLFDIYDEEKNDVSVAFVIHPMFFENMHITVTTEYPVGA